MNQRVLAGHGEGVHAGRVPELANAAGAQVAQLHDLPVRGADSLIARQCQRLTRLAGATEAG
jgi:hypothetical protein